jgi:acyl-CoA synthetase (AMP-forming)/AMP-acid ligase II
LIDGERYERVRGEMLSRLPVTFVLVTRHDSALDDGHEDWADVMAGPRSRGTAVRRHRTGGRQHDPLHVGTTGFPKGAVGSHRNHVTNITHTIVNGALTCFDGVPARWHPPADGAPPAPHRGPVARWTFPFLSHIAGVTGICVITATAGSS